MMSKRHDLRSLVACAVIGLAVLACTLGGGSQAQTPGSTALPSPPESDSNPQAGEIDIQGDLDLRYTPAEPVINDLVGTLAIALVAADGVSGVVLFIPDDLAPGTYPIGDLFNLEEADVTARYDLAAGVDSRYYESIEGTLTLSEAGMYYSGSFAFTALRTPEGAASITVRGSFGPLPAP